MTTTKTRLWMNQDGTTAVQFRTDTEIPVWMHTNLGWINVGNAPTDHDQAERFAEELAAGYHLDEMPADVAQRFLLFPRCSRPRAGGIPHPCDPVKGA